MSRLKIFMNNNTTLVLYQKHTNFINTSLSFDAQKNYGFLFTKRNETIVTCWCLAMAWKVCDSLQNPLCADLDQHRGGLQINKTVAACLQPQNQQKPAHLCALLPRLCGIKNKQTRTQSPHPFCCLWMQRSTSTLP